MTYDSKGRITTVEGQGFNKSAYTYYKDSIVLKATGIFGTDIGSVYYLDKQFRVVGSSFINPIFEYNADGYLISYMKEASSNGQITTYIKYFLVWQNGNLTTLYTNDLSVSTKKVTFQYYNLPNQNLLGYNSPFYLGQILNDRNSFWLIDWMYFGKQSKDLLKSVNFNDANQSSDIQYRSDSTGRIIMKDDAYKFIYQCQ